MNLLLSEPALRRYFDQYIDFLINDIVRFQVYCDKKLGTSRQDYEDRVGFLEESYKSLTSDVPSTDVSLLRSLCDQLRAAIKQLNDLEQVAEKCEQLLRRFLYVDEEWFRRSYLDAKAFRAMRDMYSDHLSFAIDNHLKSEQYDAAIVAAFTCLDNHLQRLLKLTPMDRQYGEGLINRAFKPEGGGLRLNADPSEQHGLRNFASGANALFRNPSAHRPAFTLDLESMAQIVFKPVADRPPNFRDSVTAQTALAVVALLMKVATKLALQAGLITKEDAKTCPFGS